MIRGTYGQPARRGFTLLEILIVGALIALFSGIAIIAVQSMYDENRTKIMWPEAQQIGTALSEAYNNIGFYPRLATLNQPINTMVIKDGTGLRNRPHLDTYGYFNSMTKAGVLNSKWTGPYSAKSPARLSQGQRSFIKMRLPDIETLTYRNVFLQQAAYDIYVVDWPADTWSNPWMVYQVSKSVDQNTHAVTYRLCKPGESPDFLNAVVSYGHNKVPGGTMETVSNLPAHFDFLKTRAALYFEDNPYRANDPADYVLRTLSSTNYNLDQLTSDQLRDSFYYPGTIDVKIGAVGMLEEGCDDIVWVF